MREEMQRNRGLSRSREVAPRRGGGLQISRLIEPLFPPQCGGLSFRFRAHVWTRGTIYDSFHGSLERGRADSYASLSVPEESKRGQKCHPREEKRPLVPPLYTNNCVKSYISEVNFFSFLRTIYALLVDREFEWVDSMDMSIPFSPETQQLHIRAYVN